MTTQDQIIPEERFLEIPWERLTAEAMRAVIEEYVTREGTDYSANELPLEEKVRIVHKQIVSGRAVIVFDMIDQRCAIISADALRQFRRQNLLPER